MVGEAVVGEAVADELAADEVAGETEVDADTGSLGFFSSAAATEAYEVAAGTTGDMCEVTGDAVPCKGDEIGVLVALDNFLFSSKSICLPSLVVILTFPPGNGEYGGCWNDCIGGMPGTIGAAA